MHRFSDSVCALTTVPYRVPRRVQPYLVKADVHTRSQTVSESQKAITQKTAVSFFNRKSSVLSGIPLAPYRHAEFLLHSWTIASCLDSLRVSFCVNQSPRDDYVFVVRACRLGERCQPSCYHIGERSLPRRAKHFVRREFSSM